MSKAILADFIVGIDTHKHTHTAVALTGAGARVGELTIRVGLGGYRELAAWARSLGAVRAFGVAGSGSYGAGLARFLRAAGPYRPRGGPSRSRAAPPAWPDGPP
jgi:transposase